MGTPRRWFDAAAYTTNEDWSDDRWHWEFLRRDNDYRKDFDQLGFRHGSTIFRQGAWGRTEGSGPGNFSEEDQQLLKAAGLRIWPFVHSHQGKYDLRMFYDPVISDWLGQGPDWGTGVHVIDPHADPIRDITKVPLSSIWNDLSCPRLKRLRHL